MSNVYYSPSEIEAAEELEMPVEELRHVLEVYAGAVQRNARTNGRVVVSSKRVPAAERYVPKRVGW